MYQRYQENSLVRGIGTWRVVLLCGPRQCGKSTLVRSLNLQDCEYRTLDNKTLRAYALSDPDGFVQHGNKTLIIDEVQRAPDLLTAIKWRVDQDTRPGQFLLTGSANLQAMPTIQESLAGRIHKVRLRPLTQGEILGVAPNFLESAFSQSWPKVVPCEREQILEIALRGGFPEVIPLLPDDRAFWHQDYVDTLLEHDLRDITNIGRHHAMGDLVKILASWSGKVLDLSAVGAHLALSRPTLQSYVNALEGLYLFERIAPWVQTDYERVGKHAKMFMTDSGMMADLLGWRLDQIRLDPDRSGKIVETMVFHELATQVELHRGHYRLFHYRDHLKREIDFIVERHDGSLLLIEVKAGATVGMSDFKHMNWFAEHAAKGRPCMSVVLYAGKDLLSLGHNRWIVPLNSLWS